MRRLLLFLLLFPAFPVLAQPPIDDLGGLVHVITLHPAKTVRPMPVQGPVRLFGSATDGHGGALLLGDGEALHVDDQGRLDRARFGTAVLPMLIFGNALYDGEQLTWCDAQAKAMIRLEDRGRKQSTLTPAGFDIGGACQLFRAPHAGAIALQAFPYLAWQIDAKANVKAKFALEFPLRKTGSPVRPCGTDADGKPLGALWPHEGHDLALVELGADLLPGKTVWTLDYAGVALGAAVKSVRLQSVNGCTVGAGRAAFWTHNQVLVFHGNQLETWIRGTGTVDVNNPHPAAAVGPYASQILGMVHLVGTEAQPVLVVAERDQGDVKLFAPPLVGGVTEPRKLAKTGAVRAEQQFAAWLATHPQDDATVVLQVENRLAAGWLEDADRLASEKIAAMTPGSPTVRTLVGLHAKARATLLSRWAQRSMTGYPMLVPGDALPGYLNELEQLAIQAPAEPLVHVAAARLAKLAGKRAAYLQHLEPLAALLEAGKLKAADFPELFDLLAARGDVAGMARFVAALDPSTPKVLALRWRATLLRAQAKFDEALKILAEPADDQPMLLALKAAVQVDAGDAQGAILTWTRALRAGMETDAQAQGGLGVAFLRRGLNELAVQALNKSVSLDPDDVAARSNLASAYAALDKRDDALQQLFGALARQPKDPLLRWQMEQATSQPKSAQAKVEAAVAILPFGTAGGSTQRVGLGDFAATLLTTALVEGGGPPIVERARLDALLTEQKLGRSAHVDHATAARLGKLLGARQVVVGNVAEFDGSVALDLRLVDVQTGRVLGASHAKSALEMDALRVALASAGTQLFRTAASALTSPIPAAK